VRAKTSFKILKKCKGGGRKKKIEFITTLSLSFHLNYMVNAIFSIFAIENRHNSLHSIGSIGE